jgi:hypothetical protein
MAKRKKTRPIASAFYLPFNWQADLPFGKLQGSNNFSFLTPFLGL